MEDIIVKDKSEIFALSARCKAYFDAGATKPLIFRRVKQSKSWEQIKGIHQIFKMASEQLPQDEKEIKAYYKNKLGLKNIYTGLDEEPVIEIVSLAKYSKPDMCKFIEAVMADLKTEYQVDAYLTDPDWLNYYEDYLKTKGE